MPRRFCACVLCAVAAACLLLLRAGPRPASASPADPPVSFLKDVAPVLQENCFACHAGNKKLGKYDMGTVEKLLAGGVSGGPVTAGSPADSELYTLMTTHDQRRMPPRDKGEAVPKAQAELVGRWIQEGAKLDAGLDAKADLAKELRSRWVPPVPPAVYPASVVVQAVAFSPDGNRLVVGGSHEFTVWDIPAGKLVARLRTRAERTHGLAFLADGTLAVAGGRPGREGDVRVYNPSAAGAAVGGVTMLDGVTDPKVLVKHLFDADDAVLAVTVSKDGKYLAAGGCDRTTRIWDVPAGFQLVHTVESHADWVMGLSFTADAKFLLTAGRDKTAKAFDLAAGESATTFPDHQNVVFGVAAAPGGNAISVGADRQLRAWKPGGEAKQLKNTGGHNDDVLAVAGHPTKPLLATASADKAVRLWDADKLTPGKVLTGLTDYVYAVAVSPDGTRVAGGDYAGEVRVWDATSGAVVAAFNATPGRKSSAAVTPAGR